MACVVVPYYLWQLGLPAIAMFFPYLIAAASVGLLVVFIRRVFRPSRAHLERTFIEVTAGGIWRTTPNSRVLILAAPQVQKLRVVRSRFKEIMRIEIESGNDSIPFFGLNDMQAFLNDVLSTFGRCEALDHEMATQHV